MKEILDMVRMKAEGREGGSGRAPSAGDAKMIEMPLAQYKHAVTTMVTLLSQLESGYHATAAVPSTTQTVVGNPKCRAGAAGCVCARCSTGTWNYKVSDELNEYQRDTKKHIEALQRFEG
jgi:hypothetical protein